MKNTKFIAGALVLAMGLLGTGYAYWTDALQVESTVSTGNLAVEWEVAEQMPAHSNENAEYTPGEITADKKGAILNIENMYPGSKTSYYATAENKGTIPVKVAQIKITAEGDTQLAEELTFTGWYSLYPEEGTGQKAVHIPIASSRGLEALNQELERKLPELNTQAIVPGMDIHFRIDAELNKNIDNSFQNKSVKLTTNIDWQQFNQ